MKVVGNCTRCGNPIYGQREVAENEQPTIKRSCACVVFTMTSPQTPFRAPNVSINQPPWAHIAGQGGPISTGLPSQAFNASTIASAILRKPPDGEAGLVV